MGGRSLGFLVCVLTVGLHEHKEDGCAGIDGSPVPGRCAGIGRSPAGGQVGDPTNVWRAVGRRDGRTKEKWEEAWENGGTRGPTVMRLGGRLGERTKWDDNWENGGTTGTTVMKLGGRLGEQDLTGPRVMKLGGNLGEHVNWEDVGTDSKRGRRMGGRWEIKGKISVSQGASQAFACGGCFVLL